MRELTSENQKGRIRRTTSREDSPAKMVVGRMYTASRTVQDANGAPRIAAVKDDTVSPAEEATVKGADVKRT